MIRPLPPGLSTTLSGQLDLSLRQSEPGLTLYENTAWIPTRAVVTHPLPVGSDPTSLALAADVTAGRPLPARGRVAGPGALFLSEAHDARWHATQSGRRIPDIAAFGWANGYPLAERGPVQVRFVGGPARALALVVQCGAWLALGVFCFAAALRRRWRRAPDPAPVDDVVEHDDRYRPSLVGAGRAIGRGA